MTFFDRHPSALRTLLYGAAAILSASYFAYVQALGLVNVFADGKSHLLQSVQMVHSLTPGVSQLGFWPPLLHVLLLPAVILLPHSVLLIAGSFLTMLPVVLAGAYFLYGICRESGVGQRISLLAPVLFVLHPFVQYFVSSAMAEVPLIVMVLGSAYYALRWSRNGSLVDLSLFGIFVSLASLSRYEGFALIPLAILFVVLHCVSLKMAWSQLQAVVLTFAFLAVLGVFFIVLYSTVYAGSPLSFLSLGAERIQVSATPSSGGPMMTFESIAEALLRLFRASVHVHGAWMLGGFALGTGVALALRRRWHDLAMVLFLFSPALFILLMMSIGRNEISVPELPRHGFEGEPYGYFYNARFALTWVGAAIVGIVLGVDALMRWRVLRVFTLVLVIPGILVAAALQFVMVTFVNDFDAIRRDEQALAAIAEGLSGKFESLLPDYDGGRVLFTRYYSEEAMLRSDVPLSAYVYEGNYRYFDQALREPWLFVRWVIIRHGVPDDRGVSVRNVKLFVQMLEMEETPEFQHYYELVQATPYLRYYKLRQHVLREQAVSLGYDPSKIPSLDLNARWIPNTFYEQLHLRAAR